MAETEAALVAYADVAAAEADGYVSIGDARSGVEHFINREHLQDEGVLDPNEVESLVYRVGSDGGRELISAMYILPPGSTMDDVPDVAGNLTVWHGHDNLCWDGSGTASRGSSSTAAAAPAAPRGRRRRCCTCGWCPTSAVRSPAPTAARRAARAWPRTRSSAEAPA